MKKITIVLLSAMVLHAHALELSDTANAAALFFKAAGKESGAVLLGGLIPFVVYGMVDNICEASVGGVPGRGSHTRYASPEVAVINNLRAPDTSKANYIGCMLVGGTLLVGACGFGAYKLHQSATRSFGDFKEIAFKDAREEADELQAPKGTDAVIVVSKPVDNGMKEGDTASFNLEILKERNREEQKALVEVAVPLHNKKNGAPVDAPLVLLVRR